MNQLKKILDLFKQTFQEWQEDNASLLAAALAYYTIFSLAPLLILAITGAGFIWSRSVVESQVLAQAQTFIGKNGADFIKTILENVSINLDKGIIASIIGVIALIYGSINIFRVLRNTLNNIWEIKVEKKEGVWKSIKTVLLENMLSFGMVMGVGLILLLTLVLNTGLSALNSVVGNAYFLPEILISGINLIVTLAIITLVLAVLFKYLPETEIAWGDVLLGCFVTSILFLLGNFAISFYLSSSSIGVTFGAAGSLGVLLIWIYYSAQILFFGAEFTQVYANKYGSKIRASKGAWIMSQKSYQDLENTYLNKKEMEEYQPDPEISYSVRTQSNVFMKNKSRNAADKILSFFNRLVISIVAIVAFFYVLKKTYN